jgi:DNA-binding NarL/FixJ family response regulator
MFKKKINLAVIDDHPIVIEGLKSLFSAYDESYNVISFSEGEKCISYLKNEIDTINVVLLDVVLQDYSGVDLCKEIKIINPNIKVIGLTNQAEQSTILQMLQNGASGFLLKSESAEAILNSIDEAMDGNIVLSNEVKKILAYPSHDQRAIPSLTKREKQLLELLAQGKTTAVIAEELFLSRFTVDTYRKNLLQKFEVKNTSELLMLLVQEKMM